MEKLASEEVVDLTGDGGVLKRIVRHAKPGAERPSGNLTNVDVRYEGKLADSGEVFDSTHDDNTLFSFDVGKGNVIRAWDIALKTMQVGEIAIITCQSDYAYGKAGSPPEIPPGATLIFEIELVAAKPLKGSTVDSVVAEKARLEEIRKERDLANAKKEEEKKRRDEAKTAAAARLQAKLDAKKGGKGGKGKSAK